MAEIYQSSFTGPEIDNTVTSSLFGVTVNGNAAPVNDHIANIEVPIYETGVWTPTLDTFVEQGDTYRAPNLSYATRIGSYTRIGDLCFIGFCLKFDIVDRGNKYIKITGLPYQSTFYLSNQGISISEFGGSSWNPNPTTTFLIYGGTSEINPKQLGGIYSIDLPENGTVFISGTGVYKIQN